VCTLVNPDQAVVCEVCSIPNPVTIPSPAFLVIGAKPSDRIDRRSFYGNPAYYTYDSKLGEVGPRHIIASFNDVDINRKLAKFYYQKFDIIIFDFSTDKFRDRKHDSIFFLLNMLKPGGLFITEFQTAAIVIDPILLDKRNSETTIEAYVKELYIENAQKKANEFSLFEPSGFSISLLSVDSLIYKDPVARTVYTGGFTYRDVPTCMVLTKPYRVSPEQENYHRQLAFAFEQKGAPAPPSAIWRCPFCTAHNEEGSPTCKVCESWRCSTCTFVNQPGAAACGTCDAPKPGEAKGGSLARKTKRRKYTKRRRVCRTRRIKKQNRS